MPIIYNLFCKEHLILSIGIQTNQLDIRSKLEAIIKRMCNEAGISGYRAKHSLRATAATQLYQSGYVEEQQIMERTGYRSTEAVRSYKRTSKE